MGGNKAWTKLLEWDKKEDFNAAEDAEWQIDGQTVAKLRSADNFHFMQVYEAGHMVPMDKPAESLAMVNAPSAAALRLMSRQMALSFKRPRRVFFFAGRVA